MPIVISMAMERISASEVLVEPRIKMPMKTTKEYLIMEIG
jgi:hypothetical protein